jgi:hypothetical protein
MDSKKLQKIRDTMGQLRQRRGIKSGELESLARMLGRVLGNRGKEPTWVSVNFPGLRPLSIPRHGKKELNRFTASNILDQLEYDLDKFEENVKNRNEKDN